MSIRDAIRGATAGPGAQKFLKTFAISVTGNWPASSDREARG